jgi:hypothetical protein
LLLRVGRKVAISGLKGLKGLISREGMASMEGITMGMEGLGSIGIEILGELMQIAHPNLLLLVVSRWTQNSHARPCCRPCPCTHFDEGPSEVACAFFLSSHRAQVA